ncbi:Acetolactate synthase isozyme 2 large subunit [Paraburkholderia aspalathi]|uniref:Acetolactate synthase isozyme 2 large subunit n=1 Tax=Paraburkholderia aspalathi TaxID=1324617 RepID=A0ABM8QD32_9BURK|nr:thiamine pyrophosphate-binding protein [Paraburkholderia aspalathi]MBK3816926.1 thiamine pyrophosphate-binding protein [Paraburkholderia aspalathi]MBK3828523.1 thiamine pyrophosphate-binding protein [Paraburkholderia aspalathi]MBK3858463.1 thiamine pyrophosphate-binding protein [Paraburkholderia aspalathi]CAE6690675.1 Acetolactate synthase isozyme 2 large subunit [Paraburkholderia aspalathi]
MTIQQVEPAARPSTNTNGADAPLANLVATPRRGGRILVDALVAQQVDTIYCVPGESFLAVLDALHDTASVRNIVCRHEGAAANMADAYGKLTGRPGVCFVTRGPGATHASVGVHTAFQDSTPMILFVGQVARGHEEREAFQEIDYRRMFGPLCKWVAEVESAARIPEYVARAFSTAMSGRPGPVVLALPEDMLVEQAQVDDLPLRTGVHAAPRAQDMECLQALLVRAERPLLIVGGGAWTEQARDDLTSFARNHGLPVAVAFRFQALYDHRHENYVGDIGLGINPRFAERVRNADLVLAIGPRLGESTTGGYRLFDVPKLRQCLVHVHTGAEELGRVYQAELAIQAGMAEFAAALSALRLPPVAGRDRWLANARAEYLAHTTPRVAPGADKVDLAQVVQKLSERLPDDAIITNGAGNYTVWVHRYYRYRGFTSQLAPTSGAMGYGVPAAIAAKIAYPDRPVVAFAGDGCFLMYGQELATAIRYRANVIVIVVNNGIYGTIRMHQERHYPGRESGTGLTNPDFVKFAESFGAYAERVETTFQFDAALERALSAGRPALLELVTDPDVATPDQRFSAMRAQHAKADSVSIGRAPT